MKPQIQVINPKCKPTKGSPKAAGLDVRANMDEFFVEAGVEYEIPLGIRSAFPPGWCALLMPRSGLGTSKGMRLLNTIGLIDPDHRREWVAKCTFKESFWLEKHERIAQMLITVYTTDVDYVDAIDDSDDRGEGFGSTGRV